MSISPSINGYLIASYHDKDIIYENDNIKDMLMAIADVIFGFDKLYDIYSTIKNIDNKSKIESLVRIIEYQYEVKYCDTRATCFKIMWRKNKKLYSLAELVRQNRSKSILSR